MAEDGEKERLTTLAEEIGASITNKSISWLDSIGIYFSSWWKDGRYYEDKLLQNLPFINKNGEDDTGVRKVEIINTNVSEDSKSYIHEVCITNTLPCDDGDGDGEGVDIILVHGYAAALGFFYTNLEALSSIPGSRLHAIDLLGFGCSGRPPFPLKNETNESQIKKVLNAESFFVDSFEKWRIERGIKKCYIVAHSLGGYLMSCYYLKYGRNIVEKLILVSPVGVEDNDMSAYNRFNKQRHSASDNEIDEYELDGDFNDNETSYNDDDDGNSKIDIDREYEVAKKQGVDLTKELTDHLHDSHDHDYDYDHSDTESLVSVISTDHEGYHPTKVEGLMKQIKTRVIPGKILTKMWEMNYSPLDIVRWFGPFAGKIVAIWVYNRFSRINDAKQLSDICHYTTRVFIENGSGEYCLGSILAPGSLGRLPLSCRLPKQIKIPVLLLYGELDWMDKNAGYKLCKSINNNGGVAKFRIIPDAGHHMYVDNKEEFERQVMSFIEK